MAKPIRTILGRNVAKISRKELEDIACGLAQSLSDAQDERTHIVRSLNTERELNREEISIRIDVLKQSLFKIESTLAKVKEAANASLGGVLLLLFMVLVWMVARVIAAAS